MNSDNPSRKQVKKVTEAQLAALLDFLKDHQDVAKGLARGRKGSIKSWSQCTKILNAYKSGATKTPKGWSKFWCDWKYRVKRRALEASVIKNNSAQLPEGYQPLSHLEEKILDIIGSSIRNIVIKNDPLADVCSDLDNEKNNKMDEKQDAPLAKRSKRSLSDTSDSSPCKASITSSASKNVADDTDYVAHEMLNLERIKLEIERKKLDTMTAIASQLKRLTDLISDVSGMIDDDTRSGCNNCEKQKKM